MFRLSVFVPIFLSVGFLSAQYSPMAGPLEGFAYDSPTGSFRAITGSLGAASLGPALLSGFEFGSVAPRSNYAVGYHEGKCLLVSGIGSMQQTTETIVDSCAKPEGTVWSGDGAVAVLFSRTENWLQIVSGFPGSVSVAAPISVTPLGGTLFAVSSDQHGTRTFVGVTGDSAGIYEVQSDASLAPVLPLAQPVAMAISTERQVLYALDGAGNQLFELNLTDLSSQSWPITGLLDPVAVEPARDAAQRQVVYVVGRADKLLIAYDADTHEAIANLPLDFSPAEFEVLGAHSFMLKTRVSDGDPLWSFSDAPEPVVYFVPASPLSDSGETQDSAGTHDSGGTR